MARYNDQIYNRLDSTPCCEIKEITEQRYDSRFEHTMVFITLCTLPLINKIHFCGMFVTAEVNCFVVPVFASASGGLLS